MGEDKLIRRYKIFKKLIDKGYTDEINKDSFKKSIQELNKEKLEQEKERLENRLIENIEKLVNS